MHIWAAFVKDHIIGPYVLEKKLHSLQKRILFLFFSLHFDSQIYRYIRGNSYPIFKWKYRSTTNFSTGQCYPHVLSHTLKWFTKKKIAVMKFPPCSPDINPIENLWSELSRFIYSRNRKYWFTWRTHRYHQACLWCNFEKQKSISFEFTSKCSTKMYWYFGTQR